MSKTCFRKFHIHANDLSSAEALMIANHFGVREIVRIPSGHVDEIKKALGSVAKTEGEILFQKGMHYFAVFMLPNKTWYVFERAGTELVLKEKMPSSTELREIKRFPAAPAPATASA